MTNETNETIKTTDTYTVIGDMKNGILKHGTKVLINVEHLGDIKVEIIGYGQSYGHYYTERYDVDFPVETPYLDRCFDVKPDDIIKVL